jgi:hypothetical protein
MAIAQEQGGKEVITLPKEQYQKMLEEHQKLLEEMKEMKAFKSRMEESQKKATAPQVETEQALDEVDKQLKAGKQMSKESFPGSTKMLLTGYATATYTATGKGYGPSQPLPPDLGDARAGRSFFSATLNPFFLWKLSDRLLFEGEMEMQLEGRDTSLALEMAQISYVATDYLTASAGKFLNPMDYFVERQHMGWVNKMPDKPLAVYDGLVPESMVGAQVRGAIPLGPTKLGYAFFAANAPTLETNNPIGLGTLNSDNFDNLGNHLAVGGRLGFYPIPELEIGYGFQYGSVRPGGSSSPDVNALLQSVDGTYVRDSERLKGVINLHAQWVWSHIDRFIYDPALGVPPFNNNRNGGYVQLAYRPTRLSNKLLSNLEPVVRYDMLNQHHTPIGFDEIRWSLGLNYWVNPSTVVKAAYEFDHQDRIGQSGNAFLLQAAVGF